MKPEEIAAEKAQRNRTLRWLMLAVAVWGGVLSLGALLFGIDDQGTVSFNVNPTRGLIAVVCVLGFIGVWMITDMWGKFRLWRRSNLIAAQEAKLAEAERRDAE